MGRVLFASFLACLVYPAVAAEPVKLPDSAKKLTAAEIATTYVGYVRWNNLAANGNGVAFYDLKGKKQHVIFDMGKAQGAFTGPIRIKDDNFCYTVQKKETCVSVFVDGDFIYEVDKNGVVLSQNKKLN
jgi:hypothetical protein